MKQQELNKALELHEKWLLNKPDGVRLSLIGIDLRGLDLSGANLSYANLRRSDLSGADLRRANLSGADLRRSDLSSADLSVANLSGADLRWAKLSCADLRRANLSGANLSVANLSSADLSVANLSGADLRLANTINAKGLDVICVQLNTSDKNRQIQYYVQLDKVTAGCFSGTLDELKNAVDNRHDKESIIYKRYQIAFKTIEDILATY